MQGRGGVVFFSLEERHVRVLPLCQLTAECAVATLRKGEAPPRPSDTGYRHRRLDTPLQTGIFECNKHCRCSRTRCANRVVQLPLNIPLQLFRTLNKGWGVRTLVDIPKGAFICVYSGAILADEVAEQLGQGQGDEYFADMDLIERVEQTKEDLLELERQSAAARGLPPPEEDFGFKLSRYFGEENVFVIDARKFGNIGRYFNHSCDPTCFVQSVLVDTHDLRFPWVAFFAYRPIRAGEEITWDYNYQIDDKSEVKIKCMCGSKDCRGRLL